MGLLESIEEDKKKLKEMGINLNEGEEDGTDTSASEGDRDEESEGSEKDETSKEGSEGEGKPEGGDSGGEESKPEGKEDGDGKAPEDSSESDEDLNPAAAAFAKMRREKRALEAELAAVRTPKVEARAEVQEENKDPEPNKQDSYEQWLEWKDRQIENKVKILDEKLSNREREDKNSKIYSDAVDELQEAKARFAKKQPDVDDAANHLVKRIKQSLTDLNPNWSEKRVLSETGNRLLVMAAQAAAKGIDPAEELYDLAIEKYGYSKKEPEHIEDRERKTDLKTISNNKKKSASPLQGGGQSGSISLTKEAVADMSLSEFSKLTPSQLRALEDA